MEWRRLLVLALLAPLAGCGALRGTGEALRRVDVLDRVFEPERFRPPPPPALPSAPPEPLPEAVPAILPEPIAAPLPLPEPPAIEEPPPDPALRVTALIRQNPWLTRFWSELTQAQQDRVARRLRGDDIPARWDALGLAERVRLLYG